MRSFQETGISIISMEKGIEVEFWDVSNIIQKNNQVNPQIKILESLIIETTSSLIKNILELEINKVFIIIILRYYKSSLSIYRILLNII